MNKEVKRIGRFTSSQMSRLCASLKSGKPSSAFFTYVDEVYCESQMGRSINHDVNTIPMRWGRLMEVVLFNLLGLDYTMAHKMTVVNKDLPMHSGTPDLVSEQAKKTGEIKCYYPKKFSAMSLCINKKDVQLFKENFKEEYWQCVSNSVLLGYDKAEIICFMPYKKELQEIIEMVEDTNFLESNNLDPQDFYFLTNNVIDSLPYLPDDSKMSNINQFEFVIPQEDKDFMIERIEMATELIKSK